jgi:Raf kinase inhibitor-like YbhB/YbcL family protein
MKKTIVLIVAGVIALALIATVIVILLLGPTRSEPFSSVVELPPQDAGFVLISPDFTDGSPIPARYTCAGEDIPPTLAWGEPPAGTESFALIVDDPDAPLGTWTHWIVYNLPGSLRSLDALIRPGVMLADLTVLFGENSWGKKAYAGPCPPSGTHHYIFQLFALDEILALADKASRAELQAAIQGHILAFAELTGTYTK